MSNARFSQMKQFPCKASVVALSGCLQWYLGF